MNPKETPQLPPQKENIKHIIWLHALVVILVWLSPFLLSWWLIIIGIAIYYLQLMILGDCILTKWQFDTKKRGLSFYYFVLVKMGYEPDMYRVSWIVDYITPWVILGIALFLQLILHFYPLFLRINNT